MEDPLAVTMRKRVFKNFAVEDSSKINIMVIHGELVQGNGLSHYNPISEGDIYNSGLDHLALGHVYKYSGIQRTGKTYWSHPGCAEGEALMSWVLKDIVIEEVGKVL